MKYEIISKINDWRCGFLYKKGKVLESDSVFLVFTKFLPYTGNGNKKCREMKPCVDRTAKFWEVYSFG